MMGIEKILLIGGGGFIGRNLINSFELIKKDIEFVVLSRQNHHFSPTKTVRYVVGDYGNKDEMEVLFRTEKFNKVFHFANTSVPSSSNFNILDDVDNNLMSTLTLLEVMKKNGCNFILYLSSGGAVYGNSNDRILDEAHYCVPISSYGITKLANEQYIALHSRNYGLNYLILRLSNPYGHFHVSEQQGIVNIAIRKALRNDTVTVWGNGAQEKDYIYVQDVISIIYKLLEKGIVNDTFNVGSGTAIALNDILREIRQALPSLDVKYEPSKPTDVSNFCLSISKLKSVIDFDITPFDDGLAKTIEWEKLKIL
ncbi:NAD-dependent epimerase/dehydratase family protein [Pedobacter heparinus]|uniref:NAD-dependent epimerase/dehydratase n=1 Tax=Pedobacter heparinus (strain ATCC 13125 / DSM 2366 / CIP 104194 / JCM 7457 / NBRC 12017 / NCIMB 9290 / NRRL B-14731 / HIM 762-3) TaxID=485917 RepID=C6XVP5_PEDHD|nr:NAD-dependent epimerase/dehydratase family protein [Pedobacter heparinus]ACU06120.1 NAD-dependent epimerase/dehydratase [Pedobacter heparinus DSM 2366]